MKIGLGLVKCFWAKLGMITSLLLNTRLIRMGPRRLRGRLMSGCEYMQVCADRDWIILTDRSDLVIGSLETDDPEGLDGTIGNECSCALELQTVLILILFSTMVTVPESPRPPFA